METYIKAEFEEMTRRAELSLKSDCPLLEDEVIVQVADRIKELESDLGNTERCEEAQIQRADKAEHRVRELEAHLGEAKREAESLAMSLWKKYYKKDSPRFELCDSVAGVISQIDNMTTGLAGDTNNT